MGRRIARIDISGTRLLARTVLVMIVCLVLLGGCKLGFLDSLINKISRDNAKMYWTNRTNNLVQRSALDGSSVENIVEAPSLQPYALAIDNKNGKIYFSTAINLRVRRANLDGSKLEDLITSGLASVVRGIALDVERNRMYCTDDDNVYRIPLDGGTKNAQDYAFGIPPLSYIGDPTGITLDLVNGKMYWTDQGGVGALISQSGLDGSGQVALINSNLISPQDIVLDPDGERMYWTDSGTGNLYSAPTTSPVADANVHILISGLSGPYGLAMDYDDRKLYWTDITAGKIYTATLGGTKLQALPIKSLSDPDDVELYFWQAP